MLSLIRNILAAIAALFLAALIIPGISYQGDARILLSAALVFAVFQLLLKPLLNLLAFPLNMLTLGFISFLINIGLFYGISYIVSSFTFNSFNFAGLSFSVVNIPPVAVPVWGTVVLGAFVASVVFAVLGNHNG